MISRLLALPVGAILLASPRPETPTLQRPTARLVPGTDVRIVPESDRTYGRLVLGLETNRTTYFMLPSTESIDLKNPDSHVRFLRRQLYWLYFELAHGNIMKAAPAHTRFFVATPEPALHPESAGNEREVFRDYLAKRVGWSPAEIERRVSFFDVPVVIAFPQDMAQPLGYDAKGRLALGIGMDIDPRYIEAARRLARAYPDEFVVKEIPDLNTEGGDMDLAWQPDGSLCVIVGHGRILRYASVKHGPLLEGRPLAREWIDEARRAFSLGFFGLRTIIVSEDVLKNPRILAPELFHLDMVVNVLRSGSSILAFVPSYSGRPVDALSHEPLSEALIARLQAEYDSVARQLGGLGYRVVRLPFSDHPVRNPVNVGKYRDAAGQQVVLLGKYPYHFRLADGRIPQLVLQSAFDTLEKRVGAWRSAPSEETWNPVVAALAAVWKEMDQAAASPNPVFSEQVKTYEGAGIKVLPVSIYPTGEGGLHCLGLS